MCLIAFQYIMFIYSVSLYLPALSYCMKITTFLSKKEANHNNTCMHRRTRRGAGELQPPRIFQIVVFGTKLVPYAYACMLQKPTEDGYCYIFPFFRGIIYHLTSSYYLLKSVWKTPSLDTHPIQITDDEIEVGLNYIYINYSFLDHRVFSVFSFRGHTTKSVVLWCFCVPTPHYRFPYTL